LAEATIGAEEGPLQFSDIALKTNLLLIVPLIFNNLLATIIVLYKAWMYRKHIKGHLETSSEKSQVEKVLFLLIESGFIYCGWWLLTIVTDYVPSVPYMLYTVTDALSPAVPAIYPMLIILVVEHQRVEAEKSSSKTLSHPIQFGAPGGQSTDAGHNATVSIIQSIVDIQSARRRTREGTGLVQEEQSTEIPSSNATRSIVKVQPLANSQTRTSTDTDEKKGSGHDSESDNRAEV